MVDIFLCHECQLTIVFQDRKKRQGNWRQSVQLLEGLQATLCDALDQRHLALFSDSDEEEDEFVCSTRVSVCHTY